ncbi:MAG: hypothetical protein AAB527_03730, partial [Patescibacteria group bacterium]
MAYDEKFYKMYLKYLAEKTVRENHDRMFDLFFKLTQSAFLKVMDLGCGLGEYETYGRYDDYAGVDLNNTGRVKNFVKADYHDKDFDKLLPFRPTA